MIDSKVNVYGLAALFHRTVLVLLAAGALTAVTASAALAEQPGMMCVQNQLNALGFNVGEPDGTIGQKTRNAAEQYRAWMMGGAGEAGWSQPPLTALNGEFWCDRVGKAHPEVAKYATATPSQTVDVTPGKLVATFNVPATGTITNWKLSFAFKTQCENDHHAELVSPTGMRLVVMERGLNRCGGGNADYSGDNGGSNGVFVGLQAAGTWTFIFQDLDDNAYTGALTKMKLELGVNAGGETSKYKVSLKGLPKKVPNPE